MKARGKAEVIQVNLRLPQDLRRRLMREAKKGRRSLNTEMIARLEHSFERDDADELLKSAQEQYLGAHKLYDIVAGPLNLPKLPIGSVGFGLIGPVGAPIGPAGKIRKPKPEDEK